MENMVDIYLFGKRYRVIEIIVTIGFVVLSYIFSSNFGFAKSMQNWFVSALFALLLFTASYFCFTFSPPKVGIFYDENTNSYGVPVSTYKGDEVLDAMYANNVLNNEA